MIPVSVLVATHNEAARIGACLDALADFGEVIVIDSQSRDRTTEIATERNIPVIDFKWNGRYPKKRQWILDNVATKHNWVLFIDADEIVTAEMIKELQNIFADAPDCAGFSVKGLYTSHGQILRHGLANLKLCLFDKRKIAFPVVDDLDIPGMGEIEGHYQPLLKTEFAGEKIGRLKSFLIHDALDDERAWIFRHQKYARWEAGMNARQAWPNENKSWRGKIKAVLRRSRLRPQFVFLIGYILLGGFMDGKAGLVLARRKMDYYKLIAWLDDQLRSSQ